MGYYGLNNGNIFIANQEESYHPYAVIHTGYPISKIIVHNGTIYTFSIDKSTERLVLIKVKPILL